VESDRYQGKDKSVVVDTFNPEEYDERKEDNDEDKDPEDDDPEAGGGEIEVGSKVKFTNTDDEEVEGEVTRIKGDTVTIEDEDGEKHKVDMDDLELVEEDDPEDKKSSKKSRKKKRNR